MAYLTSRDFTEGAPSDYALGRLDALIDTALLLAARVGGEPFDMPISRTSLRTLTS